MNLLDALDPNVIGAVVSIAGFIASIVILNLALE